MVVVAAIWQICMVLMVAVLIVKIWNVFKQLLNLNKVYLCDI
jgi:hypothetical protein